MRVAIFDTQIFEKAPLTRANNGRHEVEFLESRLTAQSAALATGFQAVSCSANAQVDAATLMKLKDLGVQLISTRSIGFNHIDIKRASELKIPVVRVPTYSPYSVAEYAVGLLLTFSRKIHKASVRVHDLNFSLNGFVGIDLHGKTIGVIGTGNIGQKFSQIMRGFGCRVVATDLMPDLNWAAKYGVEYVAQNELLSVSDVVSLHVPLTNSSRHMIDAEAIAKLKKTAILINTGRGALVDTLALIQALKTHSIGGACLDVYEEEAGIFYSDFSEKGISDDILARLITFPEVLITSHQAFLTAEALQDISETTVQSFTTFENQGDLSAVLVSVKP